jgi:hypothetical protein
VLNGVQAENARRLAAYVEAVVADLSLREDAAVLTGAWTFPLPQQEAAQS